LDQTLSCFFHTDRFLSHIAKEGRQENEHTSIHYFVSQLSYIPRVLILIFQQSQYNNVHESPIQKLQIHGEGVVVEYFRQSKEANVHSNQLVCPRPTNQ